MLATSEYAISVYTLAAVVMLWGYSDKGLCRYVNLWKLK